MEANTPVETSNPDELKEMGDKAFRQREFKDAAHYYTMAIEGLQGPPNPDILDDRAHAYLRLRLNEECIADCEQVMLIDPAFEKAYERKARALLALKNP